MSMTNAFGGHINDGTWFTRVQKMEEGQRERDLDKKMTMMGHLVYTRGRVSNYSFTSLRTNYSLMSFQIETKILNSKHPGYKI